MIFLTKSPFSSAKPAKFNWFLIEFALASNASAFVLYENLFFNSKLSIFLKPPNTFRWGSKEKTISSLFI